METVITWPHSGAEMGCLALVLQLCAADHYGGPRHMPRAVLKDLFPNPPYGAAATALSNMRLAEKQLILHHTLLYNGIIKHDSFRLSHKQLISTELAGNHAKQWPPVEPVLELAHHSLTVHHFLYYPAAPFMAAPSGGNFALLLDRSHFQLWNLAHPSCRPPTESVFSQSSNCTGVDNQSGSFNHDKNRKQLSFPLKAQEEKVIKG